MKCEECFVLLDDYVEHELNAKNTEQVAAHLAACKTCARGYQELIHEQKAYAQYLIGVEATPALWNNLQAGIEAEKSVRALPLFLPRIRNWATSAFGMQHLRAAQIAAIALVAIGAFIGLIKYKAHVETPKHDVVAQTSNNIDAKIPSIENSIAKLDGTSGKNLNDASGNKSLGNPNKPTSKIRFVPPEKRNERNFRRARAVNNAGNQAPRVATPEPEISSREAGENAKKQLMLALRITSTQLYVAQRKIQEEQRRTRQATPVSEPNREMR